MAQLLPMSDEMIASFGSTFWMARHAMRGLIRSGSRSRARSFQLCPDRHLRASIDATFLQPGFDLVWWISVFTVRRPGITGRGRQLCQDLFSHCLGIALNANGDLLGQPNAI
jgi:hypothetical protein